MRGPVPEARIADGPDGRVPESEGWFVLRLGEAAGLSTERFGAGCRFEGPDARFPEMGFNVRVLQPGQPASLYHAEDAQEAFFVLDGECVAVVEEQERPLRAGDFLHAPAGTRHVIVGAGDGSCTIVMAGARRTDVEIVYPVSPVAAKYGASVDRETRDPAEAYAGKRSFEPGRVHWPPLDRPEPGSSRSHTS